MEKKTFSFDFLFFSTFIHSGSFLSSSRTYISPVFKPLCKWDLFMIAYCQLPHEMLFMFNFFRAFFPQRARPNRFESANKTVAVFERKFFILMNILLFLHRRFFFGQCSLAIDIANIKHENFTIRYYEHLSLSLLVLWICCYSQPLYPKLDSHISSRLTLVIHSFHPRREKSEEGKMRTLARKYFSTSRWSFHIW